MGMLELANLLEQLEADNKAVDQSRCVSVRNRNCRCMRCAQSCPSGCITLDKGQGEMHVDITKCIGCGTCATVCPTGALDMTQPTDSELLKQLVEAAQHKDNAVVVACKQLLKRAEGLYDPKRVVGVPCLGRMEEGVILSLAAMGAQSVALVHGSCSECEYCSGSKIADDVVQTTRMLLEVWGCAMPVSIRSKMPSSVRLAKPERSLLGLGYDPERREAFAASGKQASTTAMAVAASSITGEPLQEERPSVVAQIKVRADGNLPHSVPNRRKRTIAALRKLGHPADEMVGTRLWGHVIIDTDVCSSCRMCATFCPTGALSKYDDEDGFGVVHDPSACSKCRTCETICPAHAITISDEVFAMDLYEGAVERYEMNPNPTLPGNPHQMYHAMRSMFTCDQMYER